jgi:hypothetical protein
VLIGLPSSVPYILQIWNINSYPCNSMWDFPHSLPKLSNFCVIGHATWWVTNVLWASEVKWRSNTENTRRGWVIVCFKNKILNSSRPLSSSNSMTSSFFVHFEWLKTWWVHWLKLYKTSFYSEGKDAMIEDFMVVILICFKSLNTEPSYTKHPISFRFLYWMEKFLGC